MDDLIDMMLDNASEEVEQVWDEYLCALVEARKDDERVQMRWSEFY